MRKTELRDVVTVVVRLGVCVGDSEGGIGRQHVREVALSGRGGA